MSLSEREIITHYRALVLEWVALKGNPRTANHAFKKHHAFYKEVRDLPQGRGALQAMLTDPEPAVRLLAATHCLSFDPTEAEPILAELEMDTNLYAADARYTLKSFHEGRLDLDW